MRLNTSEASAVMVELNDRLNDYPPEYRPLVADLVMNEIASRKHPKAGWKYQTYGELVLDLGTMRRAAIYVPDDEAEFQMMELGQCFYNAFMATADLGYQYVEGFAQTQVFAVQHAWLEDDEGRIIDPTWAHLDLPVEFECSYVGIRFATDFVIETALTTGWTSILNRDWQIGNPALKQGFITNEQGVVIARG